MSFRGTQRWWPEIGKKTNGVHFCQKRGLFSLSNFRKFRQMFLLILTLFRMLKIAGRVILKMRNSSTTAILKLFKKLEWLPFYDEINVIKLCLVFKCLNGQCPEYLSNTLTRVSDISTRQSRHGSITLRCPKYSRETEGGRTFAVAAVKEWNKHPINIRSSQNVKLFKKKYVNYLKEAYIGLDHFSIS